MRSRLFSAIASVALVVTMGCGDDGGDTTPPAFGSISASPDPAKAGDTLTITFTASEALKADPELAEAHLASADLYRLSGDLDKASKHLEKGRSEQTAVEADYFAAMIAIDKKADSSKVLKILAPVTADEHMLCALYREARVLASEEKNEKALKRLTKLLRLNSDHKRARELQARIDAGLPVLLHTGDAPEEEPTGETEEVGDTDTGEVVPLPETVPQRRKRERRQAL